jgi:hypothetical protein
LQRINGSVQAELQQTLSTQKVDPHCEGALHAPPIGTSGVFVGVVVGVTVGVRLEVAVGLAVGVALGVGDTHSIPPAQVPKGTNDPQSSGPLFVQEN